MAGAVYAWERARSKLLGRSSRGLLLIRQLAANSAHRVSTKAGAIHSERIDGTALDSPWRSVSSLPVVVCLYLC